MMLSPEVLRAVIMNHLKIDVRFLSGSIPIVQKLLELKASLEFCKDDKITPVMRVRLLQFMVREYK